MKEQKKDRVKMEALIDVLKSKDGMERQKARKTLAGMGGAAVPYLALALRNSRDEQVRWEAAKALSVIIDKGAIIPLVKVLADRNEEVAWMAAEGLAKFKKDAWLPILRRLVKDGADSAILRQGAHHVFLKQKEAGYNDLLANLVKVLDIGTAPGLAQAAARDILKRMKEKS